MYTTTVSENILIDFSYLLSTSIKLDKKKMQELFEKELLQAVSKKCWRNKTKMAEEMGVTRKTIYRMIKKYGIE